MSKSKDNDLKENKTNKQGGLKLQTKEVSKNVEEDRERADTLTELDIVNNPKREIETSSKPDMTKQLGSGQQGVVYRARNTRGKDVALKVSSNFETDKELLVEFAMKKAMRRILEENQDKDAEKIKTEEVSKKTLPQKTETQDDKNVINEPYNIKRSTKQLVNRQDSVVAFTMELAPTGDIEDLAKIDPGYKEQFWYKHEAERLTGVFKKLKGFGFDMGDDIIGADLSEKNVFVDEENKRLFIGDCGGVKVVKGSGADKFFREELANANEKVGMDLQLDVKGDSVENTIRHDDVYSRKTLEQLEQKSKELAI